jgi:hypothetical protein
VETDCTGYFSREKTIEKTILRVLGSIEFSHSLERGDPSVSASALIAAPRAFDSSAVCDDFLNHERRWLWVPAFAGMTKDG